MRNRWIMGLSLALVLLLFGCTQPQRVQEKDTQAPVVLRYYTIGREDRDLRQVNEALNDLLMERYGFQIDYRKIDWNTYQDTINGMFNTNQDFDIVFTWDMYYLQNAVNGVFLRLNDYLEHEGKALYDVVDPRLWQGVTIHGGIFGVPTNKELAPVVQFLFSEDLVNKYDLDMDDYPTLESLEPVFAQITAQEPDVIPLLLTSQRLNLAEMLGYEYIAGEDLPLVVRYGDKSGTIVNLYETPEMQQLQQTLHRFYQKGYINADATLRTAISRFHAERAFCRIGVGGPDTASSFSVDFGYPITAHFAGQPWITNASSRSAIMAVNARSAHPKEALQFLSAVNQDPEVRNMLNFGIEGVHYQLSEQDQVEILSNGYRGVPYTQGNWYILKTMVGEDPQKWEHYKAYNAKVQTSCILGFAPDLQELEQEYQKVSEIYNRFDNALLTGSVDPVIFRARALEDMKKAGIDRLQKKLQAQVDAWLL